MPHTHTHTHTHTLHTQHIRLHIMRKCFLSRAVFDILGTLASTGAYMSEVWDLKYILVLAVLSTVHAMPQLCIPPGIYMWYVLSVCYVAKHCSMFVLSTINIKYCHFNNIWSFNFHVAAQKRWQLILQNIVASVLESLVINNLVVRSRRGSIIFMMMQNMVCLIF